MSGVFANGRSVVHRRDGVVDVSGPPDVCKSPPPVPYINAARSADLAGGSKHTEIAASAIALASSNIATSTGDEPGVGGGVISSKIRGKLRWQSSSLDVRVEGKGVARFTDAVGHNGNTFNTAFIQQGRTGWAYGDDRRDLCPVCGKSSDSHRVYESSHSEALMGQLLRKLRDEYELNGDLIGACNEKRDQLRGELTTFKRDYEGRQRTFKDQQKAGTADPQEGRDLRELAKQLKEREAAIAKLEAEIARSSVFKSKRTGEPGGYMVGVMVCKEGQIFASMSGEATLPGFARVVGELGWHLCAGVVTMDSFVRYNPAIAGSAAKSEALSNEWDRVAASGGNKPGVCAAPKLLAKNRRDDQAEPVKARAPRVRGGAANTAATPAAAAPAAAAPAASAAGHIPASMTEMYFSPADPGQQLSLDYLHIDETNHWRHWFNKVTFGYIEAVKDRAGMFGPHCTVPSCKTCQTLLPMVLCEHDERVCCPDPVAPPVVSTPGGAANSSEPGPSTQPVASTSTAGASTSAQAGSSSGPRRGT